MRYVLYQGNAHKIFETSDLTINSNYPTYFVEKEKTLFALRVIKNLTICGLLMYQTEHPKLIIIESSTQDFFYRQTSISVENLDMFTYINTKFVYLENHLKHIASYSATVFNTILKEAS